MNDGTFEHDILLTEAQAQDLLNALDNTPAPSNSKRYGYGRYKRASLFLEQLQAQRWPSGESIKYFFDPNIREEFYTVIFFSYCKLFRGIGEANGQVKDF